MKSLIHCSFFALMVSLSPVCAGPSFAGHFDAGLSAPPERNILIILDASGSMWQKVDGRFKIDVARNVLSSLVRELPEGSRVGLVAYGHRQKGDCADIETLLPLQAIDPVVFDGIIEGLGPTGKTPIAASLRHAISTLPDGSEEISVVLISDGLETCGGDPCREVELIADGDRPLVFNVVGFGLEADDVSSLECAAQAGGGLYFDARDAGQLEDALRKVVVEESPAAEAFLSVKAVRNDKLEDVNIRLYRSGTRQEVAFGRTYVTPNTNPRVLGFPAGQYDIVIRSLHLEGDVRRSFKNVSFVPGDTISRLIDFSPGRLEVQVTRNGELSDAVVTVYGLEGRQEVAKTRSYRSESTNPAVFDITPGEYDVVIGSVEIRSSPEHTYTPVVVRTGETTALSHNFSSGTIRIGASRGEDLVDAVISVYDMDTGAEVARGRTYRSETSNPKEFELPTGSYRVVLKAIDRDLGKKELEIVVMTGGDDTKMVSFP